MLEFLSVHWLPVTVAVLIILLLVQFVLSYMRPAWFLANDLAKAISSTKQLEQHCTAHDHIPQLHEVARCFEHNEQLKHLWSEYTETVHEQLNQDRSLKALRATVPAETFFNTAVIVDTRLNTEFFKHLPGILTGIGIIGTFTGLLIGLNGFSTDTSNVEQLSDGLKHLMGGVQEAFYASAGAIFAAMLVTGIEKFQLNSRYKQVEELAQAVDALYNAGAGEEYLRELVESSQQSQTHTAQLKDAMVNDLKTMLENLGTAIAQGFNSTMQDQMRLLMEAQQETNKQLVVAIQEGMKEPLDKVEKAITRLAGKQENGVGELIGTAVKQIESMFGEKLTTFGNLLNDASNTMAETLPQITQAGMAIHQAGETMQSAGGEIEQAVSNASEQLLNAGSKTAVSISDAGEVFASSTTELNRTAQVIIDATESINLIVSSASEAAKQLNEVKDVFEDLEKLLEGLKETGQKGGTAISDGAKDLSALKEPLENAIKTLAQVSASLNSGIVEPIHTALDEMKRVVVSGADNLNTAGYTLRTSAVEAATSISTAGASLATDLSGSASGIQMASEAFNQSASSWQGVSSQIAKVAQSLDQSSSNMRDAATTVQNYLSKYELQNSNLSSLIKQVSDMVSQAKAQGELGQQQVRQMTELVGQMRTAQQEAAKFGEQVGDALAKGYSSFANETKQSIQQITRDHQLVMNDAVKVVKDNISELDETLNKIVQVARTRA